MKIRRFPDKPYLAIIDLFGAHQESAGAEPLEAAVAELIADGVVIIAFNGAEVEFIDWSCASALVAHQLRAQMRGGQLVFTQLRERIFDLLFEKFNIPLPYVATEQEVLALTPQPPTPPEWWFWKVDLRLYLQAESHGDITVVQLVGAAYGPPEAEFLSSFLAEVKTPKIVLEMSSLGALTDEALSPFIKLRKSHPERVTWCGLNGLPLTLLQITGMAKLFPHYPDATQAAAALA